MPSLRHSFLRPRLFRFGVALHPLTQELHLTDRSPNSSNASSFGVWYGESTLDSSEGQLGRAIEDLSRPVVLVETPHGLAPIRDGRIELSASSNAQDSDGQEAAADSTQEGASGISVAAIAPSLTPSCLGDKAFLEHWQVDYPYVAGAMANGIASVELVTAIGRAGMLGFFGAAGLPPARVGQALEELRKTLGREGIPYGANLIHSPQEPDLEREVAELFIAHGVDRVEASAYLDLTVAIVRYRTHGIHRDAAGRVVVPNRVMAKVSRIEVAQRFLAPPPQRFLEQLMAEGHLSPDQAKMALEIKMADDLTAEADSGGHTDNRPLTGLLPTLIALRDQIQSERQYPEPPRVGAAGGIATPAAAAAAFAMGAAYVVVGTVHQSCLEAGTSDTVRSLLAEADPADIAMAPAADMFEMGVKVQVLKRGTLFAMRATKLYELFRQYDRLESIPEREQKTLTQQYFHKPIEEVWQDCVSFFSERDPRQLERAARDERHRMALVFRWYLGQSSLWANRGEEDRQVDYQVWCGPSMGAFNQWTAQTFLSEPSARSVVTVAYNLLHGAAIELRRSQLRSQGVSVKLLPPARPRTRESLAGSFARSASAHSVPTVHSEAALSEAAATDHSKDESWR